MTHIGKNGTGDISSQITRDFTKLGNQLVVVLDGSTYRTSLTAEEVIIKIYAEFVHV